MLSFELRTRQEAREDRLEKGETEPPAKKWKPTPSKLEKRAGEAIERTPVSSNLRVRESALFRPTRAIGVVSDGLPFAPSTLGSADFVTVSIGRGFQVFECEKLRICYLGPRLGSRVQALMCVGQVTLTSLGNDIVAWHKLVELGRFRGHTGPPTVFCAIGVTYLITAAGSEVFVWQLSDVGLDPDKVGEKVGKGDKGVFAPIGRLANEGDDDIEVTAICHPPTYLHKVIVASADGSLRLWNVRSRSCVHTFRGHAEAVKAGGAITCMREASNVLDLVALGFASGRICLLNAREDTSVMEFDQAQGRITSLSFRTGQNAPSHLVSGAPNGDVVVWDLDKKRAHHTIDEAHHGPVSSVHFLPGQPLLLTLGRDNAIREWIFDTADGIPRLLKFRSGCPGPARKMFFYSNSDERRLIVAGGSEGGGFVARVALFAGHQNNPYSQSSLKKLPSAVKGLNPISRLPAVVDLAFSDVRHYDWPAVITAHEGMEVAFVWSASHMALAPCVLRPPPQKNSLGSNSVSAVAVSKCGNYSVIGLENGVLHRFNVQSQMHRGTIPQSPPEDAKASATRKKSAAKSPKEPRAHQGRICGVEITTSGMVVSAGSHPEDSVLRLWKLMTHEPLGEIPLGVNGSRTGRSPLLIRAHGALVAVGLDDGTLLIADLNGQAVVRSFPCGLPVGDVAFSAEGRWVAAALRGGGLRVFDLPAARCVDSFAFARPALSVCFSPTSAYLLTSHAKGHAIQMWANKFLFDPSLSAPLLRPEPERPVQVDDAPELDELDEDEDDAESDTEANVKKAKANEPATVDATPLAKDLLTLSDVPPAKWLAILHLDQVKERNKPIEPPKPLPNAPFFLPTAHEGVTPVFAAPERMSLEEAAAADASAAKAGQSRIQSRLGEGTPFQQLLRIGDFDGGLTYLKQQTPSGVHLAIEELGPLSGGDMGELTAALEFFLHHLQKAHYADELQAYLSLFLSAHGDALTDSQCRGLCGKLSTMQEKRWNSLDERCQKARCFLGMLTQTQSQW
eukprot:TRINITY_DN34135_c0_g1_i1.p1 TRINITY_DN34135_c0_g1~~TRINITY_DN34135_c0_g1_i1.p1  ORF type:complete len:1018 (+),score=216.00 TRINITY_DN34135_c0_g1_i1:173-3226(+)